MDQPDHFQDQDSVPSYWQSGIFKNNNQLMLVAEESNAYVKVARSFGNGMKISDKDVYVDEIHRKKYQWSVMDEAREEAFRVFAKAVASRNGGDPNIKYGWYGGSREQIRDILCYGFRRFENRLSLYGRGVYFSPADNPNASARASIADSDGMKHVLLCRLILGKPEQIPFGSQIDQPTSTEFDSGVDDLSSPTNYIIWEPYMNTTVLPVFVLTFNPAIMTTGLELWHDIQIKHLQNRLSSSKMAFIKKQQDDFHQNKISEEAFVRNFRIIAGDDVIRDVVEFLVGDLLREMEQ